MGFLPFFVNIILGLLLFQHQANVMLLGFTLLLMLSSYPCHFSGFNSHTVVRGSVLGSVIFLFLDCFCLWAVVWDS